MVRVIIGTEDNQLIPQKVLEYSIRKHTRSPVEVRAVKQSQTRVGGTNFGFVRFLVPQLCGYEGRAIYLDADQLVFTDIEELFRSLDGWHSVALVQDPEGSFGDKQVVKDNQSSVMVLDCEKLTSWDPRTLFERVVPNRAEPGPGQIRYREFMMLKWMDRAELQPLDSRWNHFNIVRDDTKLVHFSHVRSQPWKVVSHPLCALWRRWLREAMRGRFVRRTELLREVLKGHMHLSFLREVFF